MRSNDSGAVDAAIVVADGALEGAALIGKASAALEELIGAESAMTVMMTSLGANVQGLGPRITQVGAIGAVQTSVDASLLRDFNTVHQEAHAQIEPAVARHDPQSIVRQTSPTEAWARNRMPNDSDLVEFLSEITLQHKVGLDSLLEAPTQQSKARSQSAVQSSLQSVTNPANDPSMVLLVNGGENPPIVPSLAKSALIASDTESRAPASVLAHSRNHNVTRTRSVAQLRSLRSTTTGLAEELDSQTFGMIEAISPTTTASLHKDTSAIKWRRKNHDEKAVWPDAESVELRHPHAPEVSSEPKIGIVVVDGGYLGRWIFDCLSRQASRPSGGMTGVDPRVSATHPGAAVGV